MIALILALAIFPTPRPHRVYLPITANVPQWMLATAAPARTATPERLTLRPTTYEQLRRDVLVPGALVLPAPGVYRLTRKMNIGPGVTLDGRNLVTLVGKTVELYKADGATVRNLRIVDAGGDGLRVTHTRWALIEGVQISGGGDGELDIVESPDAGASIIVRDSIIGPGRKCMLIGDPDQPQDARLTVLLERVRFTDCHVRTPKVHRARVVISGGQVFRWTGPRLDVQLGGRVEMSGTTWIAGPGSLPGFFTPTGGTVLETGGRVIPFGGMQ